MQEVLIKPVDSNRLETILQRHLGFVPPLPAPAPTPALPAAREANVAADLAVVDLELGTRLANGSESLAYELLDQLVASLPDTLDQLREALARGDSEALLDAVHALNGACRYCGAPELALVAETLETRLRSRGMSEVSSLLEDLFSAIDRLSEWHAQRQEAPPSTAR